MSAPSNHEERGAVGTAIIAAVVVIASLVAG